jgi:hypothetical protein
MEGNSRSLGMIEEIVPPTERRSILLRGYTETELPREPRGWRRTASASRFALFFDTETTNDAAQPLRFGCYQLWEGE